MQLGVSFPQTEIGSDPIAVRDFAQAAESLGYEDLRVLEHVLGADPSKRESWEGSYPCSKELFKSCLDHRPSVQSSSYPATQYSTNPLFCSTHCITRLPYTNCGAFSGLLVGSYEDLHSL